VILQKIISGGQTGVDRAALDCAMAAGLLVGGWCPRGRLAEDGVIPDRYPLEETPKRSYAQRTEWNVRDSHGTLILAYDALHGGTLTTSMLAREKYHRPVLCVDLTQPIAVGRVIDWINDNDIKILNVAGPRQSTRPGIYKDALRYLEQLLRMVSR
jgi:Circularly permutated YpsA SLOG family